VHDLTIFSYMEFTTLQLATLLGGEVQGNKNLKINKLAKIQEGQAGAISFLSNPKYENYIYTTEASAVIVNRDFEAKQPLSTTLILVDDAYSAFSTLLEEYYKLLNFSKKGIEQPSFIGTKTVLGDQIYLGAFAYLGENTTVGDHVKIYPHVYIGDNVTIGNHTIIYAGAKIYSGTKIGNHVTIHAGAVIGSAGFGFAPQTDGSYKEIPQLGNVIIGNYVSIGANTTIDCATLGSTIIEDGVKLDNLIQVGHNVKIGKNTVAAAQTAFAGSVTIGEGCIFAGQVGVVGHIEVANKTIIGAQSGVTKSIKKEGTTILGSPAIDHKDAIKSIVVSKKLPDLMKRIEELEKKIK
jgi:UDP-3-O-[3-hydroxymyristoyl] glucosamine N-acyltransferase